MIDGETEVIDFDKKETNKNVIVTFMNEVFINKNLSEIDSFFNGDKLIQHNPNIGDGLLNYKTYIDLIINNKSNYDYNFIHKIFADGNFVLVVSEGESNMVKNQLMSIYDLFRLSDNKIVEHWDVVENIVPISEWKNSNGKFGF